MANKLILNYNYWQLNLMNFKKIWEFDVYTHNNILKL